MLLAIPLVWLIGLAIVAVIKICCPEKIEKAENENQKRGGG